jgi:hypothetical protein
LFSQLTKRGLGPNWAASQALSLATDKGRTPLSRLYKEHAAATTRPNLSLSVPHDQTMHLVSHTYIVAKSSSMALKPFGTIMYPYKCVSRLWLSGNLLHDAVESLVDLPVLLEELKKTAEPEAESHPAAKLLEDVFLQPDVFVASFGKAKPHFTPGSGALQKQIADHSASSKGKDGAKQVARSFALIFCAPLNSAKACFNHCCLLCMPAASMVCIAMLAWWSDLECQFVGIPGA